MNTIQAIKQSRTEVKQYTFKTGNVVYLFNNNLWSDEKLMEKIQEKSLNDIDLLWICVNNGKEIVRKISNINNFINTNNLTCIF